MLTGKRAFGGGDLSDTLAMVLMKEVDWSTLPADTPASVRKLLERCLARDPKQRIRDIGDVSLAMEGAFETTAPPTSPAMGAPVTHARLVWRTMPFWLAGVIASSLVAGVTVWYLRAPAPPRLARFVITPPASEVVVVTAYNADIAITPDGTRVVYKVSGDTPHFVVRAVEQLETRRLLRLANDVVDPFISPDGAWVGFSDQQDDTLWKVSILGGPAVIICDLGAPGSRGASWGADDTIIFGTSLASGLWRVNAGGGEPEALTSPDAGASVNHVWPEILPGGRAVLFTILRGSSTETAQIAVLNLETDEEQVLIQGGSYPRYSPTGHIIYGIDGTMRAVPFDLDRLEVVGNPVPIVEDVITKASGAAAFALAGDGSLVYLTGPGATRGGAARTLVWVERDGRQEPVAAPPRAYQYARVSPDGSRVALDIRDQQSDIWIWDLAREALTRLTLTEDIEQYALWMPDGRYIVFSSARDGVRQPFRKAADGTGAAERLSDGPNPQFPQSFSPDGTQLVVREDFPDTGGDLVVVSLEGERSSTVLLQTEFTERNAEVSPDGNWLAYESNTSGQSEVYVRPFPDAGTGRSLVSTAGGRKPLWAPDGRELFYVDGSGRLLAVGVQTEPTFTASNPEVLLEGRYYLEATGRNYDITPDGQRFLMISPPGANNDGATDPTVAVLVQNWFQELTERVPVP